MLEAPGGSSTLVVVVLFVVLDLFVVDELGVAAGVASESPSELPDMFTQMHRSSMHSKRTMQRRVLGQAESTQGKISGARASFRPVFDRAINGGIFRLLHAWCSPATNEQTID